jgi:glycyl-tRNA synthetase beta chain
LTQTEEKELWRTYEQNHQAIRTLIEKRDYLAAAQRFAQVFAEPVHLFFEKVFVNVEDARLRNNRLAIMKKINLLFSERIADLSQIVTGVEK